MSTDGARVPTVIDISKGSDDYTTCYYRALRDCGMRVIDGDFSMSWLLGHRPRADYLHLHWPSFLYASDTALRTLLQFVRFVLLLVLARLRGIRLLWTAHNLRPHERSAVAGVDLLARKLVIALSTRIFVHGGSAALRLACAFPASQRKLTLLPHGHWIGFYADEHTRPAARAWLGIPAAQYVFLFFGRCRPYKNLEQLTQCFQRYDGANVALWIVGEFHDPSYLARVEAEVARAPQRIRLEARFVPNDEIQLYLKACDVVVLPYAEILTSGAAMLALTFGRPVVAPRIGHLQDVVNADCGVLYDVSESDGLMRAMMQAAQCHFDETAIRAHAQCFRWSDAAQRTLVALQNDRLRSAFGHQSS